VRKCSRGGRTGELCSRGIEGKRREKEVGRAGGCLPGCLPTRWPPLTEKLMRTQCKQNLRCPQRMLAAFCDYYQYRYQSQQVICVTLLHELLAPPPPKTLICGQSAYSIGMICKISIQRHTLLLIFNFQRFLTGSHYTRDQVRGPLPCFETERTGTGRSTESNIH